MADPWLNERQSYMTQLSDFLKNPSGSLASNPAFKFMQDQGMEAVNRGAARSGMLGSGNRLAALQERGQGVASQQFFNMADLFGKLSGGFSQNQGAAANAELGAARLGQEQQRTNMLLNSDAQTRRDAQNAAYDRHMQDFWRSMPSIG